jgi:UDP-N-acetylglucosamine:LPS N-acetylglucosamine transferase
MDRVMLAADVVVENAGGLTCMEALAAGRPVLSFNPIPGHGRANVEAMVRCGIVDHVRHAEDLIPAIEAVAGPTPQRTRRLQAAAEMFRADATDDIVTMLGITQPAFPCS